MKIWFDSESTAFGGKKYFAVVEEFLVDKDGNLILPSVCDAHEKVADVSVGENAELIAKVDKVIEDVTEYQKTISERTETVESGQRTESVEKIEKVENIENIEKLESVEKVEAIEKSETSENVERTETLDFVQVEQDALSEAEGEGEAEVAAAIIADDAQDSAPDVNLDLNVVALSASESGQDDSDASAVIGAVAVASAESSGKAPVRSRNFAEKMRDADEVMQDRYDELKNYALRFRKLKARISKKFDSINAGRFQFVKLSIAGKTLKLYLNMDINTTDPKYHCKDMSDKKTYVTVPVLLRIKSGRAVKYAKRLIDQCAEQHGMLERRKPFVVDAMALIEEALKAREEKRALNGDLDDSDDDLVDDVAVTDIDEGSDE